PRVGTAAGQRPVERETTKYRACQRAWRPRVLDKRDSEQRQPRTESHPQYPERAAQQAVRSMATYHHVARNAAQEMFLAPTKWAITMARSTDSTHSSSSTNRAP